MLIGYPIAYGIARSTARTRNILLLLVVLPFWTSLLLRVYAWIGLLKANGVINNVLLRLGVIHEPITMLYTPFAMYVGIVYSYLPFLILPLYANLEKMDWQLLEAAEDLGCRPWQAFYKITLPLSRNGVLAGIHAGVHTGGGRVRDSGAARRPERADDRPRALGRVLLEPGVAGGERRGDIAAPAPGALHDVVSKRSGARVGGYPMNYRRSYFIVTCLAFGFAFLYVPILSMVVFSFNASKLVTVWDSANSPTLKWYVLAPP